MSRHCCSRFHLVHRPFQPRSSIGGCFDPDCLRERVVMKLWQKSRWNEEGFPPFSRSKAIKSEGHSRGAQFFSRHFSLSLSFSLSPSLSLSLSLPLFFFQPSPFLGFFSRNEAASLAGRQPSYDTRLHQQTKSVKDIFVDRLSRSLAVLAVAFSYLERVIIYFVDRIRNCE